jgi:hypothetical protein
MALAVSVGPTVSVGTAPDAAAGAGLALAVQWSRVALRVDAQGELPASKAISTGGRVGTNVAFATGSLCVRVGLPFACAGGGAGAVWTRTEGIARPATDRGTVIVTSLRIGMGVALGSRLYLEPSVDLGANLSRPAVAVSGRSVYETSPVWGALGVQVGAKIL